MTISRRGFLQGLGIGAGAAIGSRLPFLREARAAITEPTAVVVIHFIGGYNSIFSSADRLVGKFGVTSNNFTMLGDGLGIDNVYANSMSAFTKSHIATVGVNHKLTAHAGAREALWTFGNKNAGLVLADAMGGTASIKAAVVGGRMIGDAPGGDVNKVAFEPVTDAQEAINTISGAPPSERTPDRAIQLAAMEGAQKMSANALNGSPGSLASVTNAFTGAIDTLKQVPPKLEFETLRTAYKLGASNEIKSFKSQMAAAELMVRAGTNVVSVFNTGWDTHDDTQGIKVRNQMTAIMPPLNTFLDRMVADTKRNVTVVLLGDFARSLPNSDHAPGLSATVIGKNVKRGTTGRTAAGTVNLAGTTPNVDGLWSYVAALTKAESPFGKNQHPALIA